MSLNQSLKDLHTYAYQIIWSYLYQKIQLKFSSKKFLFNCKTASSIYSSKYLIVSPVPIWTFSIRHSFPQQNTITPYIWCWCEFLELNWFWCCPAYWNFTSLVKGKNMYWKLLYCWLQKNMQHLENTIWRRMEGAIPSL